ncbi:hypothetical protein [Microbacterium stercoris]|uniref:Uncharacterized protein n=1 Tax=Microbacterium stercoris TaxID=2820289 RepID=A0A939QLA7_9MICO|nr:hypothetical protein [Microbacterium stercoris]MBO3664794.1 hypothetical protein [Microbacterium stercoris]
MTPDIARAYARYSRHHISRWDDARTAHRFARPGGDALRYLVPTSRNVARHLTGPALTSTASEATPDAIVEVLTGLPERRAANDGTKLNDLYRGLWAALNLVFSPREGEPSFDREAYITAIVADTLAELRPEVRRGERERAQAERAAARAADRSPAKTPAERKATFRAHRKERELAFARHVLDGVLASELEPGDTITREELADILIDESEAARRCRAHFLEERAAAEAAHTVALRDWELEAAAWDERKRMQTGLDRATRPKRPRRPSLSWADYLARPSVRANAPADIVPPVIGERRAVSLALELAAELGLRERVITVTDEETGNRKRTRGFIYEPATETTEEDQQTEEDPMTTDAIRDEAAAYRELAASVRDARAELELLEQQRDRLDRGDIRGALEAHRERFSPAQVADLDAFRERRLRAA